MKPKVTLMSWTQMPLETVYAVWEASKTEDPLKTPEWVRDNVPAEEVEKLFRAVIRQRIPIGEHVDMVFMLEGVSVSFREQMVRHRIGTTASPERVGADIVMGEIRDLTKSSWWSQSMRIQNMGSFAVDKMYRMPPSVEANERAKKAFERAMFYAGEAYRDLVDMGIPMEDARELIPLGAQHRISWKLNISALQHIVGTRSCWILQAGLWEPVIHGMVTELAEKVHPIFAELATPPCIKADEFKGCVYMEECRRRHTGDDALPPCPLHLTHHHDAVTAVLGAGFGATEVPRRDEMETRAEQYKRFWRRDPFTGKRLEVIGDGR